jgi:pimeloyl-ACP methyl ester carboxylesterase
MARRTAFRSPSLCATEYRLLQSLWTPQTRPLPIAHWVACRVRPQREVGAVPPRASSTGLHDDYIDCGAVGVEARYRAVEQRIAAANGLDVQERWIDISSPPGRVRVLEAGAGDPALFINGISAPGIGMAALAGRLPGHHVLLVDLPGHGLSPPYRWQGAPVREQAVDVIAGVLDGLGIDRVTLVGNSLGGCFSLWFALDRPARVTRVVLVGQPGSAFAEARADPMMGVLTTPVVGGLLAASMRLPVPRLMGRLGLQHGLGRHAAKAVSDDIVDLHLLSMRLPGKAASFRSLMRRLVEGRKPRLEFTLTDEELASFTVPLLFVWPEDDRYLAPAAGRPSVDKIPTARFVTIPGGNFPWYDDPDQCAALVAEGL